jgi:prolyl 4-hydroxylase
VVPIAAPLCALIATQQLQPGTPLLDEAETTIRLLLLEEQEQFFMENYGQEIQELQQYMDMAYPKQLQHEQTVKEESPPKKNKATEKSKKTAKRTNEKSAALLPFTHPFYDFPRGRRDDDNPYQLQVLRTDPDIFVVPNFLSDSECDRLIQKARPHLVPCVTKNPRTGAVEEDSSRTSRNANVPQLEVPSIVDKLTELTNCTKEQLEILQVLHYASGQYFEPHTDGFSGPISACGFEESARLVTIFCYLNAVEKGGATRFGDLDLEIAPRKGMAVIHFPTTLGFEEDARTEHEGMVAVHDKWLLATWVWMHPRDQNSIFAEKWLDPLDDKRI